MSGTLLDSAYTLALNQKFPSSSDFSEFGVSPLNRFEARMHGRFAVGTGGGFEIGIPR
jgi:hypothetical protein